MASQGDIDTFCGFSGASADEAKMFLDMAGGNVEAAVELFFSTQGGGGDVNMETASIDAPMDFSGAPLPQDVSELSSVPPWWDLIWPAREAVPEAWSAQSLEAASNCSAGILQPKNGPCGVLAVMHALILSKQHSKDIAEVRITSDAIADAIIGILCRCRPESTAPIRLVRPKEAGCYGPAAEIEQLEFLDLDAASAEVKERISEFQKPGGIINLLYSAVFTRGVELVRKDALSEGELPLVTKAFTSWFCTTELMSLLLRGNAGGNVGAFQADGSPNDSWDGVTVGILSRDEHRTGVPIANALKHPPTPVWILHGGDHFTVAWAQSPPSAESGVRFTLCHWNGLPPGGPRLAELAMVAAGGTTTTVKEQPKYYKPEPGEVDEIVQADVEDKKAHPDQYRSWRYEVLLAWDRPDVQGEPRPADVAPEPKVDQQNPAFQRAGPWRCARCYAQRFTTMDFNLIPADSPDFCPKCQKPRSECGWSLWMPFADLPSKWRDSCAERYAKKIEPILWTRWPSAEVACGGGSLPDC